MPPQMLVNLHNIDLDTIVFDTEAIERVNPQRFEMRQLDAIVYFKEATGQVVGYKDVTPDEFWVRGHIPGRPLMPGVILLEAAAQLASFCAKKTSHEERFIGFSGLEDVKFRAQVTPGCRLYLLGKFLEIRSRRFKFAAQGVVDDQLIFQAVIVGMPI